jgi:hypothetical protein
VLDSCNVEKEKEEGREEYLRVERSSLNSADKRGEVGEELAAVVLEKCHVE